MTVEEYAQALSLRIVSGKGGLQNNIEGGYTCDLLSDVMGHAEMGQVWITLQTHKNVMAVASLKELAAVVIVKGLQPNSELIAQSEEENIPVLVSEEEAFVVAGKTYSLLQKCDAK